MDRRLAAAAVLAATAVPLLTAAPTAAAVPGGPTVPSAVHLPLPLTRTVQQSPSGPAALVVTGAGALRGSDVLGGYEGRTLVVGRDGRYRLVDGAAEDEAGTAVHLSPDGRRLAVVGPVDGGPDVPLSATSVVDLGTGDVREVTAGTPAGWAPDGRLLVRVDDALALFDVDTGRRQPLLPYVTPLAFSPDGAELVEQTGTRLEIRGVADGARRGEVALGPQLRLAVPGAWAPDGRLGVWERRSGCATGCTLADSGADEFRLTLRARDGAGTADGPAFDVVRGQWPRLLGWRADGSAVVETFRPPTAAEDLGDLSVVALRPGGGTDPLLDLPDGARRVDIAADLLRGDRFGGGPPSVGAKVGDWLTGLAARFWLPALAAAAAVGGYLWWRRRRSASPSNGV